MPKVIEGVNDKAGTVSQVPLTPRGLGEAKKRTVT